MAYKPTDTFFLPSVEGNVRTEGSSLTLGAGEIAFVDISKQTRKGVKILSDFSPLSSTAKLAIRMGEPNDGEGRTEDNKDISTIPFKLKDITNIYVDAPKREGVLVDDFVIGYNGEEGSEIDLDNGENEAIEVTIGGPLMGMIGLPDSEFTAVANLSAPHEGVKGSDWTMQELVEGAYLELKNYKLPGNIPLTNYVDVLLVNSENPETLPGTSSTFYNLVVPNDGTLSEGGAVQAQYPELDVKRLKWESGKTTYSVIASALPTAYQPTGDFKLKGCKDCPTGYTALEQGFVYEVVLENDGADATATVQALPGATAGTAILNDTVGDTTTYSVVTEDRLTDAEIETFVGANPTAKVELIAEDVADLCASSTPSTIDWTEGESCNSTTEVYTIRLKDTECGDSRLEELQANYSDLTITEVGGSEGACQRTYTTTVTTNLVCEECSPEFRDIFVSELPESFGEASWKKAAKVYSATAKMGIRVRGKRAQIGGGELLRDDMPFFDGSVEISLAGGYQTYTNESYLAGTNDQFTIKYFSRKADAQNLGGNLRKYEEEANVHFRGRNRYVGNNYAKLVLGQETRLKPFAQYVTYSITVAPLTYASDFLQPQNGATTYHFILPLGKQGKFETVINKLASAAGLPQVQAVSK